MAPDQPLTSEAVQAWRDRIRAETLSQYQFHMGVAIERTEGPAAAAPWFRRALEIMPGHPAATVRLIRHLRANAPAEAEAIHAAAAALNTNYAACAGAVEIEAMLDGGDLDAAAAALLAADLTTAGAEPQLVDLAMTIGGVMFNRGQWSRAVELYDFALSLDPRHHDAAHGAAYAELLQMKLAAAARRIDAALAWRPDSLQLKRLRIIVRLNLCLPVSTDVDDILVHCPQDSLMLTIRAQEKLTNGDGIGALEGFRAILSLQLTSTTEISRLHLFCGHALFALGRREEALAAFQEGGKVLGYDDGLSLALVGYAHAALGETEAAQKALDQANRLMSPKHPDIWTLAALFLALTTLGQPAEAQEHLKHAEREPERLRSIAGYFPWAKDQIISALTN
jgi:tetratricopeptide (TPR) repeat protein